MLVNVNYDDVKTKIADLLEATMRGDKIVITKNGKKVAEIVPIQALHRRRKFGSAKGKIKFAKDFDEPLADFKEYMP